MIENGYGWEWIIVRKRPLRTCVRGRWNFCICFETDFWKPFFSIARTMLRLLNLTFVIHTVRNTALLFYVPYLYLTLSFDRTKDAKASVKSIIIPDSYGYDARFTSQFYEDTCFASVITAGVIDTSCRPPIQDGSRA